MTANPLRKIAADDIGRALWHLNEAAEALGQAHQTLADPEVPEAISITIGFRAEALQRTLVALSAAAAIDLVALSVEWTEVRL
jgi:hypothetical protein